MLLKGNHADLRAARLPKMSDEELDTEIIATAIEFGLDPSAEAAANANAALEWMRMEIEGCQ